MKNIKKVMCSGLAFSDKEDMQKLHKYALKGWIFREFKGLFYILHKEEPQDLIFDYDIAKVCKDDFDNYKQIFINAGWTPISNNQNSDIYFFSAKVGTPPLHTDRQIFADKYKPIAKWSLITFFICLIITIIAVNLEWIDGILSITRTIIIMISAGLAGGSGVCFIGCHFRSKGKRLFKKK